MIANSINLKQLEAFVAVVDHGTFRGAARHLGTTQPNISSRIATLERQLDVVLMHRDAGSISLTEKGAQLLVSARDVLRTAEKFVEDAQRRDLIADRLRLGVTELVACTWLHDYLRALNAQYPAVTVDLDVNLSQQIEMDLVEGRVDLALQTAPFSAEFDANLPLGTYGYEWVACPALFLEKPTLAEIFAGSVLTHAKNTLISNQLRDAAVARGLRADAVIHSSSLTSSLQMAVDGMGIALLPTALTAPCVAAGDLQVLDCDWLPKPLEFFARFDPKRAPRFVNAAAELAKVVALDKKN